MLFLRIKKMLKRLVAVEKKTAAATNITLLTGAFGSTGNAIVDVTASPTQTLLNNNFRVLEDKLNALITALKTV